MATFSWAANASGNWNTGTLWTAAAVPNAGTADVTTDAPTTQAPRSPLPRAKPRPFAA
jgi:hypothetical protein